uniref:cryptochrome/photolyase family protein n=1 Tax=Aquiluna sp. TaxID=2053504 RepID=UPI0040472B9E
MKTLFWFRRDRRIQDNLALKVAAEASSELHSLFVFPQWLPSRSPLRQHSILASARSLDASLPGGLNSDLGNSAEAIASYCKDHEIEKVFATRGFDTSGIAVQEEVEHALALLGVELELVDSYYAVTPGTIRKDDGSPLKVYTPFYKRWYLNGWDSPVSLDTASVNWAPAKLSQWFEPTGSAPFAVKAGEAHALTTFERFRERVSRYHEDRNRCDISGTSHLSHALAHGEIHPRTLLADLGKGEGEEVFRKEIAWREFYADVLFHNPHTLHDYLEPRFAKMRFDDPEEHSEKLQAWKSGMTGYPIVDAAMRQLVQTGWMHNRARMIVASFLVKDLHFEWQVGARYFEQHLTDHDPASNSHGWQWTAGCGTDASPYYRVFNPVLQGEKFDPKGDYVRKFVPELRHISDGSIHQPWLLVDGTAHGYPPPIVDHAKERDESLARLEEIKV